MASITDADQQGARIYTEELDPAASQHNLIANSLDNCNIDLNTFYHDTNSIPTNYSSVHVIGGPCSAAGNSLRFSKTGSKKLINCYVCRVGGR